jgi:hypothetical protein
MKGIQYPVKLSQIQRFEKHNQVSINVFGFEDREIFPMRITKKKKSITREPPVFEMQRSVSLLPDKKISIGFYIKRLEKVATIQDITVLIVYTDSLSDIP